jgi:hypothetical protein
MMESMSIHIRDNQGIGLAALYAPHENLVLGIRSPAEFTQKNKYRRKFNQYSIDFRSPG